MSWLHDVEVQITVFITIAAMVVTIPWILMTKKDATSAVAWCLLVFFVPIGGAAFFILFGYQHVTLAIKRKRKHKTRFRLAHASAPWRALPGAAGGPEPDSSLAGLGQLAYHYGGFPVTPDNQVKLYHEGNAAFEDLCAAIAAARHHVHLEYFIVQPDRTGQRLLDLLTRKARQGVEVRLLYDAMGSRRLHRWTLRPLREAGGRASVFLPVNPLQRRVQVNMRDHRKIVVVDGQVGFTGGLNIGDEYLGQVARFGYWRDTHLQLRGPALAALQRIFIEDWDFAADEVLKGTTYFPPPAESGPYPVQVIHSGPDHDLKTIREIYFAAILRARQRLWIATPYFVPDSGLRDALCLAGYMGVDVRLLCQYLPDKWIPWFAGRYYFDDVLNAGVKVYQYTRGMMHSKVMLVDGEWASVGTANLDNRSLHLNFEVNCLMYAREVVAELERAFQEDLQVSIQLDREAFAHRPIAGRVVENACRLLSPVL
jgi:cardiolipin synthase